MKSRPIKSGDWIARPGHHVPVDASMKGRPIKSGNARLRHAEGHRVQASMKGRPIKSGDVTAAMTARSSMASPR